MHVHRSHCRVRRFVGNKMSDVTLTTIGKVGSHRELLSAVFDSQYLFLTRIDFQAL